MSYLRDMYYDEEGYPKKFRDQNEKHIYKKLKLLWLRDLKKLKTLACRQCHKPCVQDEKGEIVIVATSYYCYDDKIIKFCKHCGEGVVSKFGPHQYYLINVSDFEHSALEPDPRDNLVDKRRSCRWRMFFPCAECDNKIYDGGRCFECVLRTNGEVLCKQCGNKHDQNSVFIHLTF